MAEPFRVGFVPGVSPGKWLRTWAERLPSDPLEALPVEVEDQRQLLLSGALDMCFVRLPVDSTDLHVIPLYEEVPVVVVAKEHPAAAFGELDLSDLAAEHLLQDLAAVPEWSAVADEVRDGTRVAPPQMTLAQAIEVAASGAGIVVVPMSLARLHQRKDVRYRPLSGVAPSRIGLAWLIGNEDPRVETFIGIVRGRTVRSSRGGDDAESPDPARGRDGTRRNNGRDGRNEAGRRDAAGRGGGGRTGTADSAPSATGRAGSRRGQAHRGRGSRPGGPRRGRR